MEIDVKTSGAASLHDRFIQLSADFLCKGLTPRTVLFSELGFMRAMKEDTSNTLFGDHPTPRKTYGGLDYVVVRDMENDIELSEGDVRTARQPGLGRGGVVLKAPLTGPMTLEVVGRQLTAAQLCDIIRAWLDHDDATHWGDFERSLDRVVTQHGRFE